MCNLDWRQKEKGAAEGAIVEMVINSKDMNLRNPWERVEEGRAWSAAVHGFTKSWTRLNDNTLRVQNDDHSVKQLSEGCRWRCSGGERKIFPLQNSQKDHCVLFFFTYKCNSWEIISMKRKSLHIYQYTLFEIVFTNYQELIHQYSSLLRAVLLSFMNYYKEKCPIKTHFLRVFYPFKIYI